MVINHNTSGTPVAGFGTGIDFQMQVTAGGLVDAGGPVFTWTDLTVGAEKSAFDLYVANFGATTSGFRLWASKGVSIGSGAQTMTDPGSGFVDVKGGYKINGTALAASSLSDGTTGSGAVVLATSPAITTPTGIVKGDVGLGSVTNDAQTKASVVPNTAPSAGQILVGNAGGTAYAPVTLSGSGVTATLSSAGVLSLSGFPGAHYSITVENPSASENIPFSFTTAGGTITKVIAVLVGSSTPSVTYNIGYGTDVTSLTNVTTSPSAVTSTTTGTTATLNNVTVPANGWLVFKTTAQSGTVNSITVTVEF
jgi:hypothetical protein